MDFRKTLGDETAPRFWQIRGQALPPRLSHWPVQSMYVLQPNRAFLPPWLDAFVLFGSRAREIICDIMRTLLQPRVRNKPGIPAELSAASRRSARPRGTRSTEL